MTRQTGQRKKAINSGERVCVTYPNTPTKYGVTTSDANKYYRIGVDFDDGTWGYVHVDFVTCAWNTHHHRASAARSQNRSPSGNLRSNTSKRKSCSQRLRLRVMGRCFNWCFPAFDRLWNIGGKAGLKTAAARRESGSYWRCAAA